MQNIEVSFFCQCGYDRHKHYDDYLTSVCEKYKCNLKPVCAEVLEKTGKYKCSRLGPFVVFSFCVNLSYMLNFRTAKIGIKENNFR